jgi:hypothetical protein
MLWRKRLKLRGLVEHRVELWMIHCGEPRKVSKEVSMNVTQTQEHLLTSRVSG